MPEATLRPATAADAAAVRALITAVLVEYGLEPEPCGTDADLADIDGHYLARGGRFWVLVDGADAVVGSCALYPLDGGAVELRKMYLSPALRGGGWGRRMLELALATARDDGHTRMRLETASVLKEAIGLYRRYGFEQLPGDPHAPRCDQLWELTL